MDEEVNKIRQNKTSKGFIVVAWILLSIHILATVNTLYNFNSPDSLDLTLQYFLNLSKIEYPLSRLGGIAGLLVGVNVLSLVACFLGWIAQHRSKNGKVVIITSAICILSMSSLLLIKQTYVPELIQSVNKKSVEKLGSDLRKAFSGNLDNPENVPWEEYGELGPFMKLIEELWFQGQTHILEMNDRIRGHDVSTVFQINTLTSASNISQLKTNTQEILNILEEYEKKMRMLIKGFSEKIKQADYFNNREELSALFINSAEKGMEYFRIMKDYMSELERFLTYVAGKQSHITVKGDKMFFDTQEDTELYKKYCYKLIEIAAEEAKWRQDFQNRQNQVLEEIDKLVDDL